MAQGFSGLRSTTTMKGLRSRFMPTVHGASIASHPAKLDRENPFPLTRI